MLPSLYTALGVVAYGSALLCSGSNIYPVLLLLQVTRRLCGDMQPLASGLIKALTEACRADRSPAVRRAYAAAAALLCRYAPDVRVNKFIADALASLAAEDADRDDRYVAGGFSLWAGCVVWLCGWLCGWLGGRPVRVGKECLTARERPQACQRPPHTLSWDLPECGAAAHFSPSAALAVCRPAAAGAGA